MQVQSLDASMFACDLRPSSEKSLITEEVEPCFGRVVMGRSLAADRLPELTYQDFETSTGLEIVRANLLSSSPRRFERLLVAFQIAAEYVDDLSNLLLLVRQ